MLKTVVAGDESTRTFDRLCEVVGEFMESTVADAVVADIKVDAECIHPASVSKNSLRVSTNGVYFCVDATSEVTESRTPSGCEKVLADLEVIIKDCAAASGVDASILAQSLLVRLSRSTVDSGNTITDPIVQEGVGYIPDTPARVLMNRLPELEQLVADLRAIEGVHNVVAMDRGNMVEVVAFIQPIDVDASMAASQVWFDFISQHPEVKAHFDPRFLAPDALERFEKAGYTAI